MVEVAQPSDVEPGGLRRSLGRLAMYTALSALAIAQPVLDLLGQNPEVLAATKNTGSSAWVFVVLMLTGPPVITWVVVSITDVMHTKAGEALHWAAVAGFFFLLALLVLSHAGVGADVVAYGLAIVLAVMATLLAASEQRVQRMLRLLAVFPVVLFVSFVVSPAGEALRASGPSSAGAGVQNDPPIVFIVLDEFPVWVLLDREGNVDTERLPGFGALAAESTFYRNTLAASTSTHTAVPAILTGQFAPADAPPPPFASEYPRSLFTLLGDAYDLSAYESTTSLCPAGACDVSVVPTSGAGLRALFEDAGVIYGHRILPDRTRGRLPAVDLAWGNFGGDAPPAPVTVSLDPDDPWARHDAEMVNGSIGQVEIFRGLMRANAAASGPVLTFYHGVIPHRPWNLTPAGAWYRGTDSADRELVSELEGVRDDYQRFLMMLGRVDTILAEAIDSMKSTGLWDEAMVVLVADHGVTLTPGKDLRTPELDDQEALQDTLRVPMFVKLPGQAEAVTSDCPAMVIDLMPTVAAVVGADADWSFDGVDLATCDDHDDRVRLTSVLYRVDDLEVDFGLAELEDQIERYADWIDPGGGLNAFARVGRSADLIGVEAQFDGSSDAVTGWTVNELDLLDGWGIGTTPAQLTGVVTVDAPLEPGTEGLVLVDGIVAGVVGELAEAALGDVAYAAVVDPSLITRSDAEFELAVHRIDGSIESVGRPG